MCGFFNVLQFFFFANKGCQTGPSAYSPYTRRLTTSRMTARCSTKWGIGARSTCKLLTQARSTTADRNTRWQTIANSCRTFLYPIRPSIKLKKESYDPWQRTKHQAQQLWQFTKIMLEDLAAAAEKSAATCWESHFLIVFYFIQILYITISVYLRQIDVFLSARI